MDYRIFTQQIITNNNTVYTTRVRIPKSNVSHWRGNKINDITVVCMNNGVELTIETNVSEFDKWMSE